MSIDEYKAKVVSIVEEMEKEHGCRVSKVVIGSSYDLKDCFGYTRRRKLEVVFEV